MGATEDLIIFRAVSVGVEIPPPLFPPPPPEFTFCGDFISTGSWVTSWGIVSRIVTSMGSSLTSGNLRKNLLIAKASIPICNTNEPIRLKKRKVFNASASFSRCSIVTLENSIFSDYL